MRRSLSIIFLLGLALTAAAQTSSNPPISAYAGRWQASFQGKPFYTLILAANGNTLSGSMTHTRDIHVNNKGQGRSGLLG